MLYALKALPRWEKGERQSDFIPSCCLSNSGLLAGSENPLTSDSLGNWLSGGTRWSLLRPSSGVLECSALHLQRAEPPLLNCERVCKPSFALLLSSQYSCKVRGPFTKVLWPPFRWYLHSVYLCVHLGLIRPLSGMGGKLHSGKINLQHLKRRVD